MNTPKKHWVSLIVLALLCTIYMAFTAFASSAAGQVEFADGRSITGWAYDYTSTNKAVSVEIQIIPQGTTDPVKTYTVTADQRRSDFIDKIGNTGHGFKSPVNWSEFEEGTYIIRAYILSGDKKTQISDDSTSKIVTSDFEVGPGIQAKTVALSEQTELGKPLGKFRTTGYCNCPICSPGHNLTYSGTVPKANHTISADINVLPIGSKVLINGTIYTVEDIGSSVTGNKIDIYYDSHSAALAHGLQSADVYLIE